MASELRDEKAIFNIARRIPAADARAEYLQQVCGADDDLRERVNALLRGYEQQASFLEAPASGAAVTMEQPITESAGTQIGRYKLLQQIGEGGMGVVFMAEQTEPVRRKVALKIIKPGMDSRQVIARFEAERQALSLMDHPHIAKVLDAGTTGWSRDGGLGTTPALDSRLSTLELSPDRPYFVMELVKGEPITQYCDAQHLTPRERLELFLPVCQAIQHAHQKGIIHRDIKPSNVLVAEYDGKPVAKVIDFGVAKATSQPLTERTMFTAYGQIVGTLEYMSPEQARVNQLDVDTRSDIYSLGVLLYELLTGSTPFDRKRLQSAAWDEMLRIIREEEPPKPSTRLSNSHDSLPSISALRQTEPAKLKKLVRGELDWIVMKALEKDRARRYETANSLAADLLHYLADEPVSACPPSAIYRFRKFTRRNKGALATAAFVSTALMAAVVILAMSNLRISAERNAKDNALSEKVQALGEKQMALSQAQASFEEAKRQEEIAREQEGIARKQERIAVEQTALAKRHLYASQMNLATQAWHNGQVPRVLELLEGQRPKAGEDDFRGFEWFHFWRLCNGGRLQLKGHTDGVQSLLFAPDGKTLASAGDDQTVRLWDTATGRAYMVLDARLRFPEYLALSPDGTILASGGKMGNVLVLWNMTTGDTIRNIPATVSGLAFSPDGRTILGGGKSTQSWDVASGAHRSTIAEPGYLIGVLPDGRTVVTLANAYEPAGEIRFWDSESGARRLTIPLPNASGAALSFDGARLATTAGWFVKVWSSATGALQSTFSVPTRFRSVAFSSDGKKLAAGTHDRRVIVWDLESGKQIGQDVHRGVVWSVAFSHDCRTVASGTMEGAIKLWDLTSPEDAITVAVERPAALSFSTDGKTLRIGNLGPTRVIDVASGREVTSLPFSGVSAFSGNGATAGRAADDRRMILWDVNLGHEIVNVALPDASGFPDVALSPDGRQAATYFGWRDDATVKLWDVAARKFQTLQTDLGAKSVVIAEFSPDGKYLAAGFQFEWVTVWDVASGKVKLQFRQKPYQVVAESLAFSRDSRFLAIGTNVGTVTLWEVETGSRLADFNGHTSVVRALAFSADGEVLATAGADKTVRLWDARTGQERSTLIGHTGELRDVKFSPDGSTLATASYDNTVRIWRAATDPEARARHSSADKLVDAQFSLGRRLMSAGQGQEGESACRSAIALSQKLVSDFPQILEYQSQLAGFHQELGNMFRGAGRHPEAEQEYRLGLTLNESLVASLPANTNDRFQLADSHLGLAHVMNSTMRYDEAEHHFFQALTVVENIPADDAHSPRNRQFLAATWRQLGHSRHFRGRFMEAEQAFHRSIGVRRKAEGVPDRSEIASCLLDLARTLAVQDKYDEAEKACREAIALHRQVHGDTDVRVAEDFELLAVVCNRQNKRHQELLQEFPELETIWSQQTVDYLNSAAWRLATEPNPAARIPELAVKLAQRAVQRAPDQAYIVNTLGTAYYRASDWNAAIETLKNADELYQGRHFSFDAFFIAMSHWQLGDKEAARKWYGAAARWQEMFEPANDELRRFRAEAAALLGLSDQPAAAPRQHSADERELYAIILDAWPEAAWVHLRRGLERDSLGESQQAQTDYRRALELYDRVVERKPNVPQTWVQRGLTHACLGQWDKSTSDLDKAVALGAGPAAWYQPALTRLVARDLAAYREACDRILVAIGKVENGTVDDLALWTCALAPELGSDLDPAIAIAERMVREDPNAPQRRITLGALLYRDGRFAEAVSVLEQASGQSQNPNTTLSPAYPAFFLAMAHHRMGHQDEAATWLAQGRKLSDEAVTDHQAGTSRLTWNRRLTLNLLRREAEQLVEQKQTSDE